MTHFALCIEKTLRVVHWFRAATGFWSYTFETKNLLGEIVHKVATTYCRWLNNEPYVSQISEYHKHMRRNMDEFAQENSAFRENEEGEEWWRVDQLKKLERVDGKLVVHVHWLGFPYNEKEVIPIGDVSVDMKPQLDWLLIRYESEKLKERMSRVRAREEKEKEEEEEADAKYAGVDSGSEEEEDEEESPEERRRRKRRRKNKEEEREERIHYENDTFSEVEMSDDEEEVPPPPFAEPTPPPPFEFEHEKSG